MIHQRTQNDDHKHKESVPSNSGPNHVFSTVKRKQIRFAIRRTAAIGTTWFFPENRKRRVRGLRSSCHCRVTSSVTEGMPTNL